jgi:hypothetical protein
MPDFYYQIKGRSPLENQHWGIWEWPPVFSGRVTAADKKEAKLLIEEEYGRKFQLRILADDLKENSVLLHIKPLEGAADYVLKRFIDTPCKECGAIFKPIDKYNDPHVRDGGDDYCSDKCASEGRLRERAKFELASQGKIPPVIYRIRQTSTKRAYVGQTTRPFTLRWWQHLSYPSDCKFHQALKGSDITDWDFKVIEVIVPPKDCPNLTAFINERERFWIDELDAVDSGFNTIRPSGTPPQQSLDLSFCEALLERAEMDEAG